MELEEIEVKNIPVGKVRLSATSLRQELGDLSELVSSIRERIKKGKRGIIEPLVVKQSTPEPKATYDLIIGTRRYQAAKQAGLKSVPCLIEDFDDETALLAALIENIQRADLTWVEESLALEKLHGEQKGTGKGSKVINGFSVQKIAWKVSKNEDWVRTRLEAGRVFRVGLKTVSQLPLRTARAISQAPKEDWEQLVKLAKEKNLSSKEVTGIVSRANKVRSILTQVEKHHAKVHKVIKDFWFSRRFNNILEDMKAEICIRTGNPNKVEYFIPEEQKTQKEAEEYAKKHSGEYVGTATRTWHRMFIIPKTIEELRQKWEDNGE